MIIPMTASAFIKDLHRRTERRTVIGYFLRDCRNLHYFPAIQPYLDRFLKRPDVENHIIVRERTPEAMSQPDFQGYTHLFSDSLALKDCDVVLTPSYLRADDRRGLDRSKTRLIQIFHGMSDKPFTYERDFSDYDLCLCAGRRQVDRLLRTEHNRTIKWALVGYPKFDSIPHAPKLFDNGKRTLIYCPTWRKEGISSIERFLDDPATIGRLAGCYNLIVKPHPNVFNPARPHYDAALVERLERLTLISDVRVVRSGNVMSWFEQADLFIGDISTAGYEWLYFNRPMIFLNPRPGVLTPISDANGLTYLWQCGPVCNAVETLPDIIADAFDADAFSDTRRRLLHYSVHEPRRGGAAERGASEIERLLPP